LYHMVWSLLHAMLHGAGNCIDVIAVFKIYVCVCVLYHEKLIPL